MNRLASDISEQKKIMKVQEDELKKMGVDAKDNKEFRKEQIKLEKMKLQQAKASGSKEAEKEAKKNLRELKSHTYLGKISQGVTGMAKGAIKAIASKLPSMKTLLMTGGLAAILYFLKSPYFEKAKAFIEKYVLPAIAWMYDKIVSIGGYIGKNLGKFFGDVWDFLTKFEFNFDIESVSVAVAAAVAFIGSLALMFKPSLLFKGLKGAVKLFAKFIISSGVRSFGCLFSEEQ